MKRPVTVLGLVAGLAAVALVHGCMDPAHNPLAAASGASKLSAVAGEQAGLGNLANVIANELTAEELASLVNVGLGKNWSIDDSNAIKELMGQIDEQAAQALEGANIDDENATNEEIEQALADAGVEATDQQIDLLRDLFGAVAGAAGGNA